jgi:hypothetical protein
VRQTSKMEEKGREEIETQKARGSVCDNNLSLEDQSTCASCHGPLWLCHDCANNPQEFDFQVYCKKCKPKTLRHVKCSHLDWTTCGEHDKSNERY